MRQRTGSLPRRYTLPKRALWNKAIVAANIFCFSGFVLLLAESRLMPGATSNLSVLSICSLDYT